MEKYIRVIRSTVSDFNQSHLDLPFSDAGVDSMDLVTIRVDLEKTIGRNISDVAWMGFNTMSDVLQHCLSLEESYTHVHQAIESVTYEKDAVINMPQMAVEALSENWLFKEIGDIHWDMLCQGLQEKSYNLKDELGNRLYATFVRIQLNASVPLNKFIENEEIKLRGSINRYGSGMYYSNIIVSTNQKSIKANLMTSFSIRNDADNKKLLKSHPASSHNLIREYDSIPHFGNEYRLIKKGELEEIKMDKISFSVTDASIFETEYELNPYYDLNGVGLLYFAAYPIISDVCVGRYFHNKYGEDERWEQTYYTLSRDVLYYANCNANDKIIFKLHDFGPIDKQRVKVSCSLYRKSDNKVMARLFTIKERK